VITLVLGGTRSGKSALGERIAASGIGSVVYLATGTAADDDMQLRIARHRERRGDRFRTVEVGRDLAPALGRHRDEPVLVDSLGTWVAAHERLEVDVSSLVEAIRGRRAPTVIVSEEVGMGVHPSSEAGRRFRDVLGEVNTAVSEIADRVLLVVAGRVVPLVAFDDHQG
jgi:adenosyl cobinamide kinase/adenosyl cobinamide phosphate guanylyltransferase